MQIKKLLLTFIFFITISVHSYVPYPVKVNFKVNGEGTDNFVVCLADKCGYGSVTTVVDALMPVPFYINQLISYVRDKEIVKEKMVYKEIIWDKSCNTFHDVCRKKSDNSFSDTLCYSVPLLQIIRVGAFITANSKVRGSNLIIYNCITSAY